MAQGTITAKQLAAEAGTDGKRMRRFMRKLADAATTDGGEPIVPRVGQGNRYSLTRAQANALLKLWRAQASPQAPQAGTPKASDADASDDDDAAEAPVVA